MLDLILSITKLRPSRSLPALHVRQETPTLTYQDVYHTSVMRCLPEELIVEIIQWTLPVKNSCTLALVCRHWKQIIYTIHPFYLLKQQCFASSAEGFYLYSHVENQQQVNKINQALKGWLPAFMTNCQNARQAAFILDNLWLTPFSTNISSPNQELTKVLELLRQLAVIDYIPQQHLKAILQSYETIPFSNCLLITAIQLRYLSLRDIPQKLRCYAICLAAVQCRGLDLEFVPKELQTPDICLAAVQKNSEALQYVPKLLRTPSLCLTAIQQDGWTLQYVPQELRTLDLCLAAVQQYGEALLFTPKELQIPDTCLAAVQQDGRALEYVPKELKTPATCLAAVQQNGYALLYVPKELQNLDLCLAAVQQNGEVLRIVPKELKTPYICLAAVQQNSQALRFVPEKLRNLDLCLAAVQQDSKVLAFVPKELQNLCLAIIQNRGSS